MTIFNSSEVMTLLDSAWRPPEQFDEFRIVRLLGAGATGEVYLAHDLLLERLVAVKFVRVAMTPEARARVLDEARAIARLQHPNVVAIYRVAEYAGHPCLVSEYAHGRTLRDVERPMPWRQVLDVALDLTCGLAAAHRRGVIHRDVKPANTIFTDDGRAKLLDFGLAQIMDASPAEGFTRSHIRRHSAPRRGGEGQLTTLDKDSEPTKILANSTADVSLFDGISLQAPIVGTPAYMAPEIWRGEPATPQSDLYSLGILLYELLTGAAPHRGFSAADLGRVVQLHAVPRLGDVMPGIQPALAAIVDRLVERDPAARFASADALLVALEESAAPLAAIGNPDGNPYRGLATFESAHAPVFFGRRGEVRELVERVKTEPFVVVAGDSGTGKSSLCRAGVLTWLAEHGGWSCIEVVPGRHPVRSLAAALAPWAGTDEAALAELLRGNPDAVASAIRAHTMAGAHSDHDRPRSGHSSGEPFPAGHAPPRRLLLFVDQLEELLTLPELEEARVVALAVAALAVRSPSVRVLATARSDFLSRLAMLPELGDEMARGLYFLRPLGSEQLREVIVRPAAAKGVVYESEALIDTLVAQTEHAPGGLPLLQFTLAELWDARAAGDRTIRSAALDALGGVTGALTRHADRLLAGTRDSERDAARRILLRLVTIQGTRTRRSKDELLVEGAAREVERRALEVLVRGRVLVANNAQDGAYEIAHEALLTQWSTLQDWLRRDAANYAVQERIAQAAASWERMGRARDLLWGRRQLAEAKLLDRAGLAPREAAFLAASGRALRRRRMLGAGGAAVLVIAAVIIGLAIHTRARRELDALVADQTRGATTAQAIARQIGAQRDDARKRALSTFDAQRWADGEAAWTEVEAMAQREERAYRGAAEHLETILLLDPARAGLRGWLADLTFERLLRAERDHRTDLAEELASRLGAYDDGRHRSVLAADARVQFTVAPAGAQIWIERPDTPRQLVGQAPLAARLLPPGSVVFVFEAPGHVVARLPVLLARGETVALQVTLPTTQSAPPGMVFVPPGRFLFGSADSSDLRRGFLSAAPLHEASTDGYFIGRQEVTFAEWIAFLDELPPDERARRSPRAASAASSLMLTEIAPRRWQLTMTPTTRTFTVEVGQRVRYEGRATRAEQDWTKFPVAAVSYDDAVAYAAWLDRTGRIPGARLCDEYEWERAARGADARTFPSGATLAPDDANIDVTYGRAPLAFGPDEVGTHPGSRSPVGVDDMAGNVYEWTRSVETPGAPLTRGGCWYHGELSARSMNRARTEPTQRYPLIGVRMCATPR